MAGGPNWGGCEVWASLDGTNYERQGVVNGPARFGTISNALPSRADPDVIDTLAVDVTPSNGVLLGASQADADAFATLCLVDGELISYRDASLVSAHHYSLGYLRRGVYGTGVASHAPGAVFVRPLGSAVAASPEQLFAGPRLRIAFPSILADTGADAAALARDWGSRFLDSTPIRSIGDLLASLRGEPDPAPAAENPLLSLAR